MMSKSWNSTSSLPQWGSEQCNNELLSHDEWFDVPSSSWNTSQPLFDDLIINTLDHGCKTGSFFQEPLEDCHLSDDKLWEMLTSTTGFNIAEVDQSKGSEELDMFFFDSGKDSELKEDLQVPVVADQALSPPAYGNCTPNFYEEICSEKSPSEKEIFQYPETQCVYQNVIEQGMLYEEVILDSISEINTSRSSSPSQDSQNSRSSSPMIIKISPVSSPGDLNSPDISGLRKIAPKRSISDPKFEDVSDVEEWTPKPKKKKGSKKPQGPLDRKERKKLQNRNAATKYREKKKLEVVVVGSEEQILEEKNLDLKEQVGKIEAEVKCLKGLMREMLKAKGILPPYGFVDIGQFKG